MPLPANDTIPYVLRPACLALAVALMALSVDAAFAAGVPSAMGSVICSVIAMIQGTLGRALATLAVLTLGFGALLGRVTYGQAAIVAAGIGVIFGAATLATTMLGGVVPITPIADCAATGWDIN